MQAEIVSGNLEESIKAEGIKGGDLLWVLPNATAAQQLSGSSTASFQQQRNFQASQQDRKEGEGDDLINLKSCQGTTLQRDNSAEEIKNLHQRHAWSLSDYIHQIQEANSSKLHILIYALHAALLEAGLQPAWSKKVWSFCQRCNVVKRYSVLLGCSWMKWSCICGAGRCIAS